MSAATNTLSALILGAALAGCASSQEQVSPLDSPDPLDAGAPVDAGPDAAPPKVDAGTLKRTVMTRSPFGGAPGNHLIDGDFELSTVPHAGAQLGWTAYSDTGNGEVDLRTETGGLCRSGLRCAVFEPKTVLFIRGASARGKGNIASAWAKLPEGVACAKVRPILVTCDTLDVGKQLAASAKDADGWCQYTAAIGKADLATCVYVENTLATGATALLDAFVLGPDDGTVQPLSSEAWAPEASTVATLQSLRETMIRSMPFGRRPRPLIGP